MLLNHYSAWAVNELYVSLGSVSGLGVVSNVYVLALNVARASERRSLMHWLCVSTESLRPRRSADACIGCEGWSAHRAALASLLALCAYCLCDCLPPAFSSDVFITVYKRLSVTWEIFWQLVSCGRCRLSLGFLASFLITGVWVPWLGDAHFA